jgi:hypothetical protein
VTKVFQPCCGKRLLAMLWQKFKNNVVETFICSGFFGTNQDGYADVEQEK